MKPEFVNGDDSWIVVGNNAYVLYRTQEALQDYPIPADWHPRSLWRDGVKVNQRGDSVTDAGEYVCRVQARGSFPKCDEGAPQGIFAPEYAEDEINYLCKCVLALLIVRTVGSPYTTTQAAHLQAVLAQEDLLDEAQYEAKGVLKRGLCICPLCLQSIRYKQLHAMADFTEAFDADNAAEQVPGATRSTIINLFHIDPLRYDSISHIPSNIAWGHHICNTRLGQRPCVSLKELIDLDRKVAVLTEEGTETFGWISVDRRMIRSPDGAVWIQISGDSGTSPLPDDEAIPDVTEPPDDDIPISGSMES